MSTSTLTGTHFETLAMIVFITSVGMFLYLVYMAIKYFMT
jgi:hypothetical protein